MSTKYAVRNVTVPSRYAFGELLLALCAVVAHTDRRRWRLLRLNASLSCSQFCFCQVCAGGLTKATQVLDHLWVSGQEVTGDKGGLQREGVTHIVNCSIRLANFYPKDFSYHRVSWADESGQVREVAGPVRRAR